MTNTYEWTDNPTVSGVSVYDPDVLNDCLMHLKYDVSTEFDGKITTCSKNDFSNITSTAKSTVAKLSAPSTKNVSLSVGPSGSEYAAPASGWFAVEGVSVGSWGWIKFFEKNSGFSINTPFVSQSPAALTASIPVSKGQIVTLTYANASISSFKFYYAEGDAPTESEA